MSKESERVYLERRMAVFWKSASSGIPCGFENTNFKPPENAVYAEFFIVGGRGVPIGWSGGQMVKKRTPGFIQVTVWAPDESGTKTATILRDLASRIFELHRGRTDDGDVITFGVAEHPNAPKVNGWYPCIVKVPFHRDEDIPVSPGNV